MRKRKEGKVSASKFYEEREMYVAKNTFISYLRKFSDELTKRGIVEAEPHGTRMWFYILDEKELKKFFKEKGIYVFKD